MEEKDWKIGYYLLIPACIILAVVSLYPLLRAILTSFYAKSLLSVKWNFIGLEHYRYLLTSAEFWRSFGTGIIYTFSTVGLQLFLGIITALLLNRSFKGRNLARGFILFPYMLPSIVAVISWRWMLYDISGVLNYFCIDILHVRSTPITFSGSSWAAMTIVVLISVWRMFPFVTLCCLARLQAIPLELYEAAKVDGSTAWQRFWFITLPQLKGIIFVVILLRGIWMFNEFDTIWLLTEGGPNHSTETVPIFTYITAFGKWNMGRGSAVAVITFIILAIVFLLYSRIYRLEES
jgi:multiple sugar transport system permease protein